MASNESDHISFVCNNDNDESNNNDNDYISFVCNYDREGLRHLGKHLLSLLDWRSLVRLKRASHQVKTKICSRNKNAPAGVAFPPASAQSGKASPCSKARKRFWFRHTKNYKDFALAQQRRKGACCSGSSKGGGSRQHWGSGSPSPWGKELFHFGPRGEDGEWSWEENELTKRAERDPAFWLDQQLARGRRHRWDPVGKTSLLCFCPIFLRIFKKTGLELGNQWASVFTPAFWDDNWVTLFICGTGIYILISIFVFMHFWKVDSDIPCHQSIWLWSDNHKKDDISYRDRGETEKNEIFFWSHTLKKDQRLSGQRLTRWCQYSVSTSTPGTENKHERYFFSKGIFSPKVVGVSGMAWVFQRHHCWKRLGLQKTGHSLPPKVFFYGIVFNSNSHQRELGSVRAVETRRSVSGLQVIWTFNLWWHQHK